MSLSIRFSWPERCRVLALIIGGVSALIGPPLMPAQSLATGNVVVAPGITVIAGGGTAAPSSSASPAQSVALNGPSALALDATANHLYIADTANNEIERLDLTTGQISVVAGGGNTAPSSNPIPPTAASLSAPSAIVVDGSGDLFIADSGNNLVEVVSAATGQIVSFAGGGTTIPSSLSMLPSNASLRAPTGVAIDGAGNVFIADSGNRLLEEIIAATGQLVVVAGGGSVTVARTAITGSSAKFGNPTSLAVGQTGSIYVADLAANQIDQLNLTTGKIAALVGGGSSVPTIVPTSASNVALEGPRGVGIDGAGNIYIADSGHGLIEKWSAATNQVAVLAGGGSMSIGSTIVESNAVTFGSPAGVGVDSQGDVYVADSDSSLIESVTASTEFPTTAVTSSSETQNIFALLTESTTISSITASSFPNAGQEFQIGTISGCDTSGSIANPAYSVCTIPITFNPAYPGMRSGTLLISSAGTTVGQVALHGIGQAPLATLSPGGIRSVVGGGSTALTATAAACNDVELGAPVDIAFDNGGDIFISDFENNVVEEAIAATGQCVIVAGGGGNPPTTSPQPATSVSLDGPEGLAVDGSGSLFIADYGNGLIERVSLITGQIVVVAGGGIVTSLVTSTPMLPTSVALSGPGGLALDESGNLYIAETASAKIDEFNAATGKIAMIAGGGVRAVATGTPALGDMLNYPLGVAVDAANNIYVADSANNLIEEVNATTGQLTVLAGGGNVKPSSKPIPAATAKLNQPARVAVDAAGNVYVSDYYNNLVERITAATGMIQSVAGGGTAVPSPTLTSASNVLLGNPSGVFLDGSGNLYLTDINNALIEVVTPETIPLSFPATSAGTSSASQSVYVANIGNTQLDISSLSATANFGQDSASTTCSSSASLVAGASCTLGIVFQPSGAGNFTGVFSLADDNLNQSSSVQQINLSGGSALAAPVITWSPPANIIYGTSLGTAQLNAKASYGGATVPGTFVYSPSAGSTPTAGIYNLNVTFIPNDTIEYATVTATVPLTVEQASPVITWHTPAAITPGTPLGTSQLNATASFAGSPVAGSFDYWPSPGSLLPVGTDTISTTFTPQDTVDFTLVTATVQLTVAPATPVLNWATPSGITYGTALSSAQLNATASFQGKPVPGTMTYLPSSGTIPPAGTTALSVTFTPADTVNFATVTANVPLVVSPGTPTIDWATPSGISYGTALSSAQLNATASFQGKPVPGTMTYLPPAGTIPPTGANTLSAIFTPQDVVDFAQTAATVVLTVAPATPVLSWATPSGISYGTALSNVQLNATASFQGKSVPGTMTYLPSSGTIPPAGTDTLSVVFSPEDSVNFASATALVTLKVAKATPTITWSVPSSVTSGTALSTAQLNAVASFGGNSVEGTYSYTPGPGTVVSAGTTQLTVTFMPADTVDFTTATASVPLTVTGADFNVVPPEGSSDQTVAPGGSVTYAFSFTPTNPGGVFGNDVTFGVTGLPANWPTPTFTPAKIPAGTMGPQSVSMTVDSATGETAQDVIPGAPRSTIIALGLLLVPWLGCRPSGKGFRRSARLFLLVLVSVAFIAGLGGCGSSSSFGARVYTLVVTATSGGASVSTNVTLTVQ